MNCNLNLNIIENITRITFLTKKGLISIYEQDISIVGNGILKEIEFNDKTIKTYGNYCYFLKTKNNFQIMFI